VNPEELLNFLSIAGKLKTIPRTGWVESGVENPESVADHSYRTALTAMLLSDMEGLDTCRVMLMALLHDLAESEMGDITPMMKQEDHLEQENRVMKKILNRFSEPLRQHYWEVWREYQEKKSPESVLVHDADKIDMVLQAYEYQQRSPNDKLDRFWHAMVSPERKNIVEQIKERRKALEKNHIGN